VARKTIRLLFFVPDPYPTFRHDVTTLFGKYLPRHGIQTDIVGQAAEFEDSQQSWLAGLALIARRRRSPATSLLEAFAHAVRVLLTMDRGRYDAIQVRDEVFTGLLALSFARWRGQRFFYWMSFPMSEWLIHLAKMHGRRLGLTRSVFMLLKGYVGRWLIYRIVLPRVDHIFAQSDRMAEELIARGLDKKKITAVPMGVDMECIDSGRIEPPRDARIRERRTIVYLGTLGRARRIDFLLDTMNIVREEVPTALLVLAGDAPEPADRAWLDKCIADRDLGNCVIRTGWLKGEHAWQYVCASEVAVSPLPRGFPWDVASPTKVVEYLALGVPVVANDQPDQEKVLRESAAGICVPYEPVAFGKAIIRLLQDKGEALDTGSRGPGYVRKERSYNVISARLASVYRRLLVTGCEG